MVVRKAKARHLFTFERLCYAAGVRKQIGAGPSPVGRVPQINRFRTTLQSSRSEKANRGRPFAAGTRTPN